MNLVARRYVASLVIGSALFVAIGIAASAAVPKRKELATEFLDRAKRYLDLRKKVEGSAPKPNNTPEAITARQHDLGDKLRVARAGARQGEIFTPEISRYFRHQLKESMEGQRGKEIRRSLRSSEPVNIELQVNMSYPENVPLQSTPPSLLRKLPQLPEGLEYRLLNRELVLRDAEANFIVDYVPDALPDFRKKRND